MNRLPLIASLLLLVAATSSSADDRGEGGFTPMFNGQDLTGWVNVNCAPGTFYVKNHEIITTGKPTGYLRTERQYENFIAEFDWMHVPSPPGAVGNSGFFVWADPLPAVGTSYTRGIEVQVLVNLTYRDKKTNAVSATSQGDLFSIWGATCVPDRLHPLGWLRCLPSENRCKGAGEWNHYRIEANNGAIKLAVNGKVVSGVSKCKPRRGFLALESEGSECHFRNLKIKELPTTYPKLDEQAEVARPYRSLYTGIDLAGWDTTAEGRTHWQTEDNVLIYDGKAIKSNGGLRTNDSYSNAEFMLDFRFPKKVAKPLPCDITVRKSQQGAVRTVIAPNGGVGLSTRFGPGNHADLYMGSFEGLKPRGEWNRLILTLSGQSLSVKINGRLAIRNKREPDPDKGHFDIPAKGVLELNPGSETEFRNLFVRELNKR
jgi:hypothetical protein